MAKKKVYAIKEGFDFSKNERVQNKLVDSWSECQKYIKGVKGAIYKSFEDIKEAESFLEKGSELLRKGKDSYDKSCLHIYVDGSYNQTSRKYSYGVVAVMNDVVEYIHGGSGQNDLNNNIRQIAGELKAAIKGVEYALEKGHKKVVIFHDYEGICHHATGFWARKDKSSIDYYEKMNSFMKNGIKIEFVQVKSHEEDLFNEMADTICKKELNIDNDRVIEKYLENNKIKVKDINIKTQIENLITKGYDNIVLNENLIEDKNTINDKNIENINTDFKDFDKTQKIELINKINDILEILENDRLEEVLKYVKRKKYQKK